MARMRDRRHPGPHTVDMRSRRIRQIDPRFDDGTAMSGQARPAFDMVDNHHEVWKTASPAGNG